MIERSMMTRTIVGTFLFTLTAMLVAACTDDPVAPTTPVDTTVVAMQNMHPDSVEGWLYYSIDGDSVVPAAKSVSVEWDVRMAYLLCCGNTRVIKIQLNSGNVGPGSTQGVIVKSRFENVTALPSSSVLRNDDTLAQIVPQQVIGSEALFIYQGSPNHTIQPSPDKVIAIRTRKGRLVKFQFTSIYEGAPATPTQETPIGFYHFRYAQLSQ
ncbi:MAG: HmuY family protein [Ignavibacteria bacterium]|nr:HmuY family protein [Ignavibacteria bacterium]